MIILSHLSLVRGIHFGGTTVFFSQICEEVLGMFCGVCKQTRHQTWLQLFTTSPLPMLLLTFLVTCTTTYWYCLPVHKLQRNNSYIRNKETFTSALAAKMYVDQFPYSEGPPVNTSTDTYQKGAHVLVFENWHLYWLLISDSYSLELLQSRLCVTMITSFEQEWSKNLYRDGLYMQFEEIWHLK